MKTLEKRDPLASNTDPTDEELQELVEAAFSPEKLGTAAFMEAHYARIRASVIKPYDPAT